MDTLIERKKRFTPRRKPEGRYAACRHRLCCRDGFAPERDLRLPFNAFTAVISRR